MQLTSESFKNRQNIPRRYTGEGEDISPDLQWSNIPVGTRSFALICEDPDAPTSSPFVHWVIYNLSPNTSFLPEGIDQQRTLSLAPIEADQGVNSFGKIGYGGPMPPVGHGVHHYYFKLFALNTDLGLKPGATKEEFLKAIEGHVLDEAVLIGQYRRPGHHNAAFSH